MHTPAVRRVCAAVDATSSRERADLVAPSVSTPHGWHPLVSEPGVAVALATEVATLCGHLCRQRLTWWRTVGLDAGVDGRAFATLSDVITERSRSCSTADDALVDTLAACLEASPHIQDVLGLMRVDFGGVNVTMMDCLVGCACDTALKHPVSIHHRELAGCDGSDDADASASASGGNAYTVARERVARLASYASLLLWSIELERVAIIRAIACSVGMTANDSTCPREGQQV